MLSLELLDEVVDQPIIKVLTTQVSVTSGGLDFEDTFFNGQEGNIECTTAQIKNENVALARNLLVKAVGNSGSSRFVDDTQNSQTRDHTSILGCLSLGVVEVSRDGNDSIGDYGAQIGFSSLLHFDKNHGRNFFGRL